jgi:hypothetical protein
VVRIAIAVCAAVLLDAAGAGAQGPETIDAPQYHAAHMSRGQSSLTEFALDIPDKQIVENQSRTAVLKLGALAPTEKYELLGVYDYDNHITAVLDAPGPRGDTAGAVTHHLQVWRSLRAGQGRLLQAATVTGGPRTKVRFFNRHESRDLNENRPRLSNYDPPKVFVSVTNTTDYDDVYALDPKAAGGATKIFSAWEYDLVDLANDGKFEIVAWQRMTYDLRCRFSVESEHSYPEVYAGADGEYAKLWPPANWRNPTPDHWSADRDKLDGGTYQIQGTFADLRGDGKYELIALVSRADEKPAQWLGAYELKNGAFAQMAMAQLPSQKIAFMINRVENSGRQTSPPISRTPRPDTSPHIIFRMATAPKCTGGGALDGDGTSELTYRYTGDGLFPYARYIGAQ